MSQPSTSIADLTAAVVAASVGNHTVAVGAMPALIAAVRDAVAGLGQPAVPSAPAVKPTPAVPIRKSVTPDHIVCLEDGKTLTMLKRSLRSTHNLSPDEHRARWGLPPEYPMVAPNDAAARSDMAKSLGLGRKR
ncbi:MucR family transcriptional regulator [Azospirillum soli]|uniref:MucR family transcriptional regulator n=1 Tax=Azospirillum soli TaxID=1304799 RepID=UPI001AE8DFA2|nr:MucR family transcriptional regulator [Azospirillum soli]MBP2312926.1 putative transcriptional regulator [Azospirillum soli]